MDKGRREDKKQMRAKKEEKVILALSGGIDSAVAGAILKREGFDVVGVFLKLWSGEKNKYFLESERKAKKVAEILKIPFYVFDFSKEFKKKIVNNFLESYKRGITPNPCVLCNKEIKFGLLLEKALAMGADYIASGHYARVIKERKSNKYKLLRAKDKNKDQSYFLWRLNQNQLGKILFPLGSLKRKEVEILAQKFELPVAKIKKSVEICFVPQNINDFLRKNLREKRGKIIDVQGKVLGEHRGLWFYTIGQRKGIFLPAGPYYVLDKDLKKNLLIVTKNERDLLKKELVAQDINWISGREPKLPLKIKAKIRYRCNLISAIISKVSKKKYKIKFFTPQRAITPGQSIVFYQGEEVLGGGIIS